MAEKRQARRRTMGTSPLDLYLQPGKGGADAAGGSDAAKPSKAGKASEAGKAGAPALGKLTVTAPAPLLERLRGASYWSREPVVDIVRRAVEREVARLEEKHGTEPAPPLRPGRKVRR